MNHQFSSIYVHFPYCDVKCAYCDFYSLPRRIIPASFFEEYISHLKKDLLQKKKLLNFQPIIHSIFFGGGTPSKLPATQLREIISFIQDSMEVSPKAEITIEANPESLKQKKMEDYLQIGINRLSIGIQTRHPSLLRYLGRIYHNRSYKNILEDVKKSGFKNYNVDLIYGIPFQTWHQIKDDIDWVISGGVKHISAYCLSIERSTLLEHQIKEKHKKKPSLRRQEAHYEWVTDYLIKNGFSRYEISNFAKSGYECRHNLLCWRYQPYLGLGTSSHSFLAGQRLISSHSLNHYLQGKYFQTEKSHPIPDFFIGMFRILKYQSFQSLKKVLQEDEFHKLYLKLIEFQKRGWIKLLKKGFQITRLGAKFSDSMILEASG